LPSGLNRASRRSKKSLFVFDTVEARIETAISGHTDWLTGADVSRDGGRFATSSQDKTARVWNAESGAEILRLEGHSGSVTSVAFNVDATRIATAGEDGAVRIWDGSTGDLQRELRGHDGSVTFVAYSPNTETASLIASSGDDATVRIRSGDTGTEFHCLRGHAARVQTLAFSHDGQTVASAGEDGIVLLWSTRTGEMLHEWNGRGGPVTGVCFGEGSRRIACCTLDGSVRLWDVASGQEALSLHLYKRGATGLTFSPDGRQLAVAGGAWVRLWNADPATRLLDPRLEREFADANRAWHDREAKRRETDRQFAAAEFHLSRLIRTRPDDVRLIGRRAHCWAELGKWENALADFAATPPARLSDNVAVFTASAKLAQGHTDEFRRFSLELVDTIDDSIGAREINRRIWYSMLFPVPSHESARLVALAEQAVAGAATEADRRNHVNTRAAALYRAERFEEAIATLEDSIEQRAIGGQVEDWLFLAMAEHRLGHANEAREWLAKAESWLAAPTRKYSNGEPTASHWWIRIGWGVLAREARSLIESSAPTQSTRTPADE